MRTKFKYLFMHSSHCKWMFVLFLVLFGACNGEKTDNDLVRLETFLFTEFDQKELTDGKYIFIYLDGCTGCYPSLTSFMEKNAEQPGVNIILVTQSRKKLALITEKTDLENVYFDTRISALYEYDLITALPMIYVVNHETLDKYETSPTELANTWF